MGNLYFHWADYLVFCSSLAMSVGIGLYYAIKDRRKKSTREYLLAGRNMKILPMAASSFATVVPSVGYIMFPVEVYYFGFGYIFNGLGACLGAIPIAEVIAPVFHKLNVVSAFEYLETRFSRSVRRMASVLQAVMQLIVLGMFTYAPAVALAQVSGMSVWWGIVITISVCTIYTTIGGMKAVMWSDFAQAFLMFAGIAVLALKGLHDLGGFERAFEIAYEGGRINKFNWTLNPFVRSSVWTYLIGAFFACFVNLSSNQLSIQRFGTLPTAKDVKTAIYIMIPGYFILSLFFLLAGLAMYGHFADCDPLLSGQVQSVSQLVPVLVMKILGPWPGLPGLFIATIFAASLSTVSSGQSALAAVFYKDWVEPIYSRKYGHPPSDTLGFVVAKSIACLSGVCIMLVAFLVVLMGGDLFQLLNKFMGIFVGPIGGLFTLAILVKSVTDVLAVMVGFIFASIVGIYMAIGSEIYKFTPPTLPVGHNCSNLWHSSPEISNVSQYTSSSTVPSVKPTPPWNVNPTGFPVIFNLHPLYYTVLTYSVMVGLSVIIDKGIKCRQRRYSKTGFVPAPSSESTKSNSMVSLQQYSNIANGGDEQLKSSNLESQKF